MCYKVENCLLYLLTAAMIIIVATDGYAYTFDQVFSTIDTRQGLSDNQVLHIVQAPDGRMVITTLGNINIYDGKQFDYVHYSPESNHPIPKYEGFQHVYIGKEDIIWNKSWGYVQCFDLKSHTYVLALDSLLRHFGEDGMPEDIFIDRDSDLWSVKGDSIHDTRYHRHLPLLSYRLQDVEVMGDTAMLFYITGVMEAYDRQSGDKLWSKAPYTDPNSYPATSLVRTASDGTVWQIRSSWGKGASLFRFNVHDRKWKEVLHTPYMLHTLTLTPDNNVYVASAEGLWYIDSTTLNATRIKHVSGVVKVIDIDEGFNTIFIDRSGGHWIGTYSDGLLYSPPPGLRVISRNTLEELGIDSVSIKKVKLESEYLISDSNGRAWQATNDGLQFRDSIRDISITLYTEDGLSNNAIKSLAEAPDGSIWAATANGINRISVDSLGSIEIKSFTSEDGALTGEYSEGEAYISENGWPLFRSPVGWTIVSPTGLLAPYIYREETLRYPKEGSGRMKMLTFLLCGIAVIIVILGVSWLLFQRKNRQWRTRQSADAISEEKSDNASASDQEVSLKITEATNDTVKSNEAVEKEDEVGEDSNKLSVDDREFIIKATAFVEANLTTGYTVEKLSSDLCMERTGLYKRLITLLDKTPSTFIRSIRLKHVADLILEGRLSMTEIAEQTGFSSSSHMSRYFKEEYGCTPSDYPSHHTTS